MEFPQAAEEVTYRAAGVLHYSPKLLGQHSDKWWLVIDCDREIGRYYRHLLSVATHGRQVLDRAAWSEHITVIRDEEPSVSFKHLWEKYEGRKIHFTYSPKVETNGTYFWLPVWCGEAHAIRKELGLVREPLYPLHLTIGHTPLGHGSKNLGTTEERDELSSVSS